MEEKLASCKTQLSKVKKDNKRKTNQINKQIQKNKNKAKLPTTNDIEIQKNYITSVLNEVKCRNDRA